MDFKDYYKILGVAETADAKAIKAAYRKLARQYHPDMNSAPGAEEKFKEAAEAYEVLKDPQRRAEFDELRRYGQQSSQGFRPPPGWQSFHASSASSDNDFSDFFNSFFADRGSPFAGMRRSRGASLRGQDIEIEMPVLLEETLLDTTKSVEYYVVSQEPGQGTSNIKKHLNVKIPKGVTEGERIRLKHQGHPGVNQGEAGDLYLHIRLVPHPLFDVQGHNLTMTLPIAPWEAALGAKVTVPTLKGKISITIAPNSQTGQTLRIKGRGLRGKVVSGDLFVILKVVMPSNHNSRMQALWRELADAAHFDPRPEWGN